MPELEAAAADDVDRRRELGREGRVAEPGADDHVADPDPLGRHRQRGQDREPLERDLVGRLAGPCGSGRRPRATRSRAPPPAWRARPCSPTPRPGPSRRTRPSSPGAPSDRPASCPPCWQRTAVVNVDRRLHGDGFDAELSRRAGRRPAAAGARLSSADGRPSASIRPLPSPVRRTRGPRPTRRRKRSGPPFHMTDMIAAEPALAGRILGAPRPIRGPARPAGRRHRARRPSAAPDRRHRLRHVRARARSAVADILREAMRAAGLPGAGVGHAAQAFELSLDPPTGGLVIGVSHEGATAATNRPWRRRARPGARTALVTVSAGRSPGAALADIVVDDRGAGPELVPHGRLRRARSSRPLPSAPHLSGRALDAGRVRALVAGGRAATRPAPSGSPARLGGAERLIVVGIRRGPGGRRGSWSSRSRRAPGCRRPMRDLETFLHGHLPATGRGHRAGPASSTDRDGRAERAPGRAQALAAARVIGHPAGGDPGRATSTRAIELR